MAFFASRSLRLHYEVVGDGDPVVFIHGITNHCWMWAAQLATIVSSGHRAVLIDLAGHGLSSPVDTTTSIGDLAADVVALADHLGLDEFAVCGLSIGGAVAQQLLIEQRDRVTRAVLVATSPVFGEGARPIVEEWKSVWLSDNGPVKRLELTWPQLASASYRSSPAGIAYYKAWSQVLEHVEGNSLACIGDGLLSFDVTERLTSVVQPVLVIGGADDPIAPPAAVEFLAACLSAARLEIIEQAQHLSNLERPDRFNDLLMAFLCEESRRS